MNTINLEMKPLWGFHIETEAKRLGLEIDALTVPQLSELWFFLRIGRITGSRIGKILFPGKFGGPEDVMRDMVREYHGYPTEFTGNVATQWGNDHEAEANAAAAAELGDVLTDVGIVIHPKYPWLAESPDGLWFSTGEPNQTKCPYGIRNEVDPVFVSIDDRPDYWAQVQLSLEVTDKEQATFVQWTPHGLKIEKVKRDREWFATVLPELEKFHARYLEIIASEELSAPYLKDKTFENDTPEFADAADRFKAACEAEALAKEVKEAARQELIDMADHRTTKGNGVIVKRFEKKGSIQWAVVQKKHADAFKDIDLDKYRGKTTEQVTVGLDKPKKEKAA